MPKWSFLASLPALHLAIYSPEQIEQARSSLREQLHHIGAKGDLVDDFVERLLNESLADTDNQHDIEDWTETTMQVNEWKGRGDVIRSEYLSPEFKLMSGAAHFTLNSFYKVPAPKGDYVILNQTWSIVGDDGSTPVPLTQMYNHHWLIGGDLSPLDMCEDDYFFGGGAEYRNMDYTFPDGYGQGRVNATGQCGANLHFISTEDLATRWEGFNDPDGNHGAAVKLAAECGFEPGRAPGLCEEWGDGSFLCCFTGSRALVNNKSDDTKRTYRLKGVFEYIRDLSDFKHLQVSLLDVGGNTRTENGQALDAIAEWTVESHLNNEGVYTRCNETVCTATRAQVVGDGSRFGYGLCSGEMIWGYMHMHAGGILGSMAINGEEYCQSLPVVGSDPANPAGNEQGFLVGETECVDHRKQGNKVRLEAGDVVTLTTYYDVDQQSQRHFPMPGGKHGGIMALYFALMDCDAGTFGDLYVKRNDSCVPVPQYKLKKGQISNTTEDVFDTKEQCEASEPKCGDVQQCSASGNKPWKQIKSEAVEDCCDACLAEPHCAGWVFRHDKKKCNLKKDAKHIVTGCEGDDCFSCGMVSSHSPTPSPQTGHAAPVQEQALVSDSDAEPNTGEMNLLWRDCGGSSKLVNFTALTPSKLEIGTKNRITATGQLSSEIGSANITYKMAAGVAGLTLASFDAEACSEGHGAWTLVDQIHLQWQPLGCPVAPGEFSHEFDIWVSPVIPTYIAHTTSTLVAHNENNDEIYCLEVVTTTSDSFHPQEIMV
jgi:hypothetical protein